MHAHQYMYIYSPFHNSLQFSVLYNKQQQKYKGRHIKLNIDNMYKTKIKI